jgi:hypothetical protein
MSKNSKIPRMDSGSATTSNNGKGGGQGFRALLPEVIKYSSRYCPWCRYVMEVPQSSLHKRLTHCPRCAKEYPLLSNLDKPKAFPTWWFTCPDCVANVRNDFKYCSMCGKNLESAMEAARDQHIANCRQQTLNAKAKKEREQMQNEREKLIEDRKKLEEEREVFQQQKVAHELSMDLDLGTDEESEAANKEEEYKNGEIEEAESQADPQQ